MPYAIAGVGRSVGLSGSWGHYVQVLGWPPNGSTNGAEESDCSDVLEFHRRAPTVGWKLLEQGLKVRRLLRFAQVGVSSVIDASDLDELTFVSGTHKAISLTLIAF